MNQLLAIALNTFREAIRNRLFAAMVLFAIGMLVVVAAFSSASLNEEVRLMKDMGLFLTSTFSVLIAIFVGVNLVYKEIERKTIYTVAPKPIFRAQFLFGKYLGLSLTLAVLLVILGSALAGLYAIATGTGAMLGWLVALWAGWVVLDFGVVIIGSRRLTPGSRGELPVAFDTIRRGLMVVFAGLLVGYTVWLLPSAMLQSLLLIYVETQVVTAVALLFSSFSSPMLSGMLTFGVFVIGRFSDRLSTFKMQGPKITESGVVPPPDGANQSLESIVHFVAEVCPDLTIYNTTPYVVYEQAIPWAYMGQSTMYGLSYIAVTLALAAIMFNRRDFV